jgi:hypothetical protein
VVELVAGAVEEELVAALVEEGIREDQDKDRSRHIVVGGGIRALGDAVVAEARPRRVMWLRVRVRV